MMKHLRWRIALPSVILILAATLGLTIYISDQVRQVRLADLEQQLLADARLLADNTSHLLEANTNPEIFDQLAHTWANPLRARITIIDADGLVIGESHDDRTQMDNHLRRPEVQLAIKTEQGISMRYSATLGYEMMYGAVPIRNSTGEIIGIMRVALPLDEIEANVSLLRQNIVFTGFGISLVAGLLAIFIAWRITQPILQLTAVAKRMAGGDLNARLFRSSRDEVGKLTQTFNTMADRIREQVSNLDDKQSRLTAVLEHMADGVLMTDADGHVQLVNAAAIRMLNTSEEQALGHSFAQVAAYYPLIQLWNTCREQNIEQSAMVELSQHELFLYASATPFEQSGNTGILVILQDLTRIQRLETIRRDFISNISHELRTPLAGLKALVETLRGAAIKDRSATKRFLKRMDIEVDTMTQMVEELLALSRIESGQAPLNLVPTTVAELLIPPIDRLRPQAERAAVKLDVIIPPDAWLAMADVDRVQIALTNLVHNAIKFTLPGGRIFVTAQHTGNELTISVNDTGVGIPAEDLERIFERFYKADRARSGGGTGLGLAIAKHIIQGHGGRIWAESVEGKGSTFFFTLPLVNNS